MRAVEGGACAHAAKRRAPSVYGTTQSGSLPPQSLSTARFPTSTASFTPRAPPYFYIDTTGHRTCQQDTRPHAHEQAGSSRSSEDRAGVCIVPATGNHGRVKQVYLSITSVCVGTCCENMYMRACASAGSMLMEVISAWRLIICCTVWHTQQRPSPSLPGAPAHDDWRSWCFPSLLRRSAERLRIRFNSRFGARRGGRAGGHTSPPSVSVRAHAPVVSMRNVGVRLMCEQQCG